MTVKNHVIWYLYIKIAKFPQIFKIKALIFDFYLYICPIIEDQAYDTGNKNQKLSIV